MDGKRDRSGGWDGNWGRRERNFSDPVPKFNSREQNDERTQNETSERIRDDNRRFSESRISASDTSATQQSMSTQNETAGQSLQRSANNRVNGEPDRGHQTQGPAQRVPNRRFAAVPQTQEIIGLGPVREASTRPPDTDADGRRRMAVCEETDDAQNMRTKMRVYMKRF